MSRTDAVAGARRIVSDLVRRRPLRGAVWVSLPAGMRGELWAGAPEQYTTTPRTGGLAADLHDVASRPRRVA